MSELNLKKERKRFIRFGIVGIIGSLVDFGIFFFRNAKTLLAKGSGPYFYLPKLEHYNLSYFLYEFLL